MRSKMDIIAEPSISFVEIRAPLIINHCAGNVIKELRKRNGLSGYDLGCITGYSQQQISRYERGASTLNLSTLVKFSFAFNIKLSDLINKIETEMELEAMELETMELETMELETMELETMELEENYLCTKWG